MKKLRISKCLLMALMVCLLVTAFTLPAWSSTGNKTVELTYRDIKITLNGTPITPKDANGNAVEPFIIDGTTYLPIRAIADALGLDVGWDPGTSTVTLKEPSGAAPVVEEPSPSAMVWAPDSGLKYHSTAACSGIQYPEYITLEDAISRGLSACGRCW